MVWKESEVLLLHVWLFCSTVLFSCTWLGDNCALRWCLTPSFFCGLSSGLKSGYSLLLPLLFWHSFVHFIQSTCKCFTIESRFYFPPWVFVACFFWRRLEKYPLKCSRIGVTESPTVHFPVISIVIVGGGSTDGLVWGRAVNNLCGGIASLDTGQSPYL